MRAWALDRSHCSPHLLLVELRLSESRVTSVPHRPSRAPLEGIRGGWEETMPPPTTTMASAANAQLTETPRSLRKVESAATNSVGKVDLRQYRAKSAQDMEGRSVLAEFTTFLDELLPIFPSDSIPKRQPSAKNPFEKLKNADELIEAKVVELMVSHLILCWSMC